jgi:hypothetical protein
VFCDAAIAAFAVFTPERHAEHTLNAEVMRVVFPQTDEFVNDLFLLIQAGRFRHKTRVINHANAVEVEAASIEDQKEEIAEGSGPKSICFVITILVRVCVFLDLEEEKKTTNTLGNIDHAQRIPTQNAEPANIPAR